MFRPMGTYVHQAFPKCMYTDVVIFGQRKIINMVEVDAFDEMVEMKIVQQMG